MKTLSVNYVSHFGSVKIHKLCLYWSVFSPDINGKIISTVRYFLSHFCCSANYRSRVSKFHNVFLTCSETEARSILKDFSIAIYGKFNCNFSVLSWAFFHLVCKLFKSIFLVPFCWSVNCMSRALNFKDVQKLKHEFVFGSF